MIRVKSKLLRKGLVIVVLPTLFQLIFLLILANFLVQEERGVERIIESKRITATASGIVARVIDAELLSIFYNAQGLPFIPLKFDETRQGAEDMSKQLIDQCKGNRERHEMSLEIDKSVKSTLARLSRAFTDEMEKDLKVSTYMKRDADLTKAYGLFTTTFDRVDTLLSREKDLQRSISKVEKDYRKKIRTLIIWSVAISIALTFILAFYITLSTTGRLKIVLDNTKRLLNREQLAKPVGGDDEISQLDRVFHATANDLAAVDRHRRYLVSLVRDDLATPLRQIQFSLHNLSQGVLTELSDKAETRLTMAAADTDRVIRLIDDLMSIETMQGAAFELEFRETTSSDILWSAVSSVKQLAERNSINLEMSDPGYSLVADKDRIVQVLINFLSNAIKFSPDNGTVVVRVEEIDDGLRFSVRDQGRGIPPDKQRAVFERFQQVDSDDQTAKGGTGLGLPISRTIVEQHGGNIGVMSQEDKGSEFWFVIPIEAS